MPEAAVAHDRQRAPLHHRRHAGADWPGSCRSRGSSGPTRTARRSRRRGSRCRRRCAPGRLLLRQLQRGEHRPLGAADAEAAAAAPAAARRAARATSLAPLRVAGAARRGRAPSVDVRADGARRNRARPAAITSTVYSPAIGSMSLPCSGVWMSRAAQQRSRCPARCTRAGLPRPPARRACRRRSRAICSGTSGIGDVEHQQRQLARAERVGQAELLQRADQRVVEAALHDRCRRRRARPANSSLSSCSAM